MCCQESFHMCIFQSSGNIILEPVFICVFFFSPSSKRHEENLALPSSEKQALECTKAGVETWEYKAKNALMYYPEGKDWSLYLALMKHSAMLSLRKHIA